MTFAKSIDQLTREDIQGLVDNGGPESRTLDYKDQLPTTWNDKAKHDLLADFSAFANTAGGWIFYGVSEKRDDAGEQTGIPETAHGLAGVSLDGEILRIHQILDAGLEPRIPGVQLRGIDGFPGGPVLAAHIPRSWLRPHMLTNRSSPFYGRNSRGCYQLDVQEVRTVVLGAADGGENLRRFRRDRLAAILNGEVADLLLAPYLVLHVVPLEALGEPGTRPRIDVRTLDPLPLPLGGGAYAYRFSYHGRFGYDVGRGPGGDERIKRYVQVFREGTIETLNCVGLGRWDLRTLPSLSIERGVITTLDDHLKAVRRWGLAAPAVVMLTLLGASGWVLGQPEEFYFLDQLVPFTRDLIVLPEVLVEDYSQEAATVLRPALDVLWQAAGRPQSPYYNDDGTHR